MRTNDEADAAWFQWNDGDGFGGGDVCGGLAGFEPSGNGAVPAVPAESDQLVALSLTEVSERIHARTVTSTQLVKALLDRINVYNPKVNCYITVMGKEALAQAEVLDAEQKTGKFRGPLHGIPVALKDNIDAAGTRTTAASPMFKRPRADGRCGYCGAVEEERRDHYRQAESA